MPSGNPQNIYTPLSLLHLSSNIPSSVSLSNVSLSPAMPLLVLHTPDQVGTPPVHLIESVPLPMLSSFVLLLLLLPALSILASNLYLDNCSCLYCHPSSAPKQQSMSSTLQGSHHRIVNSPSPIVLSEYRSVPPSLAAAILPYTPLLEYYLFLHFSHLPRIPSPSAIPRT